MRGSIRMSDILGYGIAIYFGIVAFFIFYIILAPLQEEPEERSDEGKARLE